MPIRPQDRHHYGHHWRTVIRPRILRRAGGLFIKGEYQGGARCERCAVVDGSKIIYHSKYPSWYFVLDPQLALLDNFPVATCHHRHDGRTIPMQQDEETKNWERADLAHFIESSTRRQLLAGYRELVADWKENKVDPGPWAAASIRAMLARPVMVIAQIGVAHLNHTPGDDRPRNLAALCRRCHLKHDEGHHRETRATRKDLTRPLLALL